jgi:nicotinate-nucleotide pyrophosphorylase (carboxylating)
MHKEFHQTAWDEKLRADWQSLLQLAIREDFGEEGDWTTNSLVDENALGAAAVVARQSGVVAGMPLVAMTLAEIDPRLHWLPELVDGQSVGRGSRVGVIRGPVRGMLSAERIVLNMICRLSGVASLTKKYVDAIAGTQAKIYDTRKTTPGWRRLEKYAVRCGGGWNHRGGLFEAVLIKDNHLAWGSVGGDIPSQESRSSFAHERCSFTPAQAVRIAREYLAKHSAAASSMMVEVEVDTLEQLEEVLPVGPDIVLLDNMQPDQLRQAVEIRGRMNPAVELEASGGINLPMIRDVAQSGVERISVGALTHSAVALDFGLDWLD